MKKISIIIPTYNPGDKLRITLNSIKNNYSSNVEVIVVDGLSGDETKKICKDFKSYIDIFISQKDNGIYDAMNKGIKVSNGEFLYFIGAGDKIVYPLKKIIEQINENVDFLYGNCYFKKSQKIYNGEYNQWKISNDNICHQAIFYRKELFNLLGVYDTKYKYFSDWWMNLKCFGDKNIKKKYIKEVIADYEEGGFSSQSSDVDFCMDRDQYIYKNFDFYVKIMVFVRRKLAAIKNWYKKLVTVQ